MTEEKKMKLVFDPAFFETFEGTQEELDELIGEITSMFEGKSPEEIKAMSRPVDWDELEDDEAKKLKRALDRAWSDDDKPTLQ